MTSISREEDLQASIRVLVVEDDLALSDWIQTLLGKTERLDFQVETAENLNEALGRFQLEQFDVIILDLDIPEDRGVDPIGRLRAAKSDIPILALSFQEDLASAAAALKHGAQAHLHKNLLDRNSLLRHIHSAMLATGRRAQLEALTRALIVSHAHLERLAEVDPLTKVLNRRGLQRVLTRELGWQRRLGSPLVAILADLDDFKAINDHYGHASGDLVLQEIARRLQAALRATDYVARVGGDEFLLLLPQTSLEEGVSVSEKVRVALESQPFRIDRVHEETITASLGTVKIRPRTARVLDLLSQTKSVLQQSKSLGKNLTSFQEAVADPQPVAHPGKPELAQLVEKAHFRVMRQPIFRLSDLTPVACELFSRSTLRNLELPEQFFSLARDAQILPQVDLLCLRCCVEDAQLQDPAIRIHLNLFPTTLIEIPPDEILDAFPVGADLSRYVVELDENHIIGDPSYLEPGVRVLQEAGVQLAITRVGFGNSFLESLILLEPDYVKLAPRLIQGVGTNPQRRRPLLRLIHVLDALETQIMAEGLEMVEDLEALQSIGILYGQGYHLAPPT
ncbi:MAG: GGDEF domain-containing response regulator [Planctomycetota bacterium]|nr:MAG: GGDEF domain-containing response regulator [Planctomycetota bacterium]